MVPLDGCLRYFPVAVLFDGQQYLIEKYGMAVFTPTSNARLKERPSKQWTAAGFGVTKSFQDAPALPAVASELSGIMGKERSKDVAMVGQVKLDADFTGNALHQVLRTRNHAVVHIASHFIFEPGDDSRSFLLLGDGDHLTLQDMRRTTNLFSGVQLLTLSACNTGMGDSTAQGKEVEGLGVLAQDQGAKAVIASLWSVFDESTAELMQRFYRIRENSTRITKLDALRNAQLGMLHGSAIPRPAIGPERAIVHDASQAGRVDWARDTPKFQRDPKAPFAHPYYWAPFFLMGNWL